MRGFSRRLPVDWLREHLAADATHSLFPTLHPRREQFIKGFAHYVARLREDHEWDPSVLVGARPIGGIRQGGFCHPAAAGVARRAAGSA